MIDFVEAQSTTSPMRADLAGAPQQSATIRLPLASDKFLRKRRASGDAIRFQRRQLSAARPLAAAAIFDRAAPPVRPRLRCNVRLQPFPLACQPPAADSERPTVASRLAEWAFNLDAISAGSIRITIMKLIGASTYGGMPVGTLAKTAIDTATIMQIRFVNGWVIVLKQVSETVLFRP
ncbi:hypothetical protein CN933_10885 [Sinorhizobium sp. M4_45]|nr:hypothetical protein CN933_10885 [Sinorhizobium sp. M4_45]